MATLQLGEEVAHALIRNLAGNDNIPDRNSIRGWASSLWLGWVRNGRSRRSPGMSDLAESRPSRDAARTTGCRQLQTSVPAISQANLFTPGHWGFAWEILGQR